MAGLFCWIEGWDFGTSLYFQYITYLTIGFGDVVPAKEQVKLNAVNNPDLLITYTESPELVFRDQGFALFAESWDS